MSFNINHKGSYSKPNNLYESVCLFAVIIETDDCSELLKPQENIEFLMVSSCTCYENALEHVNSSVGEISPDEEARHELIRRLGNVRNELGVKYMFWAQEEYTKYVQENNADTNSHDISQPQSKDNIDNDLEKNYTNVKAKKSLTKEEPLYLKLAMKSYDCLIRGIQAFNVVQDNVNLAFLFCNMGRFMRFRAHLMIPNEK